MMLCDPIERFDSCAVAAPALIGATPSTLTPSENVTDPVGPDFAPVTVAETVAVNVTDSDTAEGFGAESKATTLPLLFRETVIPGKLRELTTASSVPSPLRSARAS